MSHSSVVLCTQMWMASGPHYLSFSHLTSWLFFAQHPNSDQTELHPEAKMEQIQVVTFDFESAILGSMGAAFPWTRPRECWFHYRQAIFRKSQEKGLQVEYRKKGVVY